MSQLVLVSYRDRLVPMGLQTSGVFPPDWIFLPTTSLFALLEFKVYLSELNSQLNINININLLNLLEFKVHLSELYSELMVREGAVAKLDSS